MTVSFGKVALLGMLAWCVMTLGGCMSPSGLTVADQRASVLEMSHDALGRLYADSPSLKKHVESAPGYAVFSNFGMKIIVAGGGNGYGVVHNNKTGKDTYMKMAQVNVGLGLSIQEFRAVFVFNNPNTLQTFVDSGWEFGAGAQAGAVLNHDGADANASGSVNDIDIYQITKSGIALEASVGGTKYWKNDDLNSGP